MKTFYTSYFARAGNHPKAVAISGKVPPGYKGKRMISLAPSWELWKSWKTGETDDDGYTVWFLRILEERKLDPQHVADALEDGSVLICYESPEKFCHRHIVAEWLERAGVAKVSEMEPTTPKNTVDECFEF